MLKSAEKEKQNATKMRLFMEKCVGFGAFLLGRETRSVMSESPISKKLSIPRKSSAESMRGLQRRQKRTNERRTGDIHSALRRLGSHRDTGSI